ncbi:ahpC/TSA antioxidant enzyme domain-containing protein [Purpureocillium lavendulum]|uniref:AhpC/TSA antioxidant enzyme domain-containing protein n=1 Tax=Purpureocillium lavendulum TaxID=1247861 RepID=A0AB34GA16_9HYPO|nr:ahpC/TSA antioxidant enzyme domain-containing protein [Purpureocillium lavendulum]
MACPSNNSASAMFSSLGTKIALKKLGLPSNTLDFSSSSPSGDRRSGADANPAQDDKAQGWGSSWLSVRSLPLTAQPWLSPPPAAVPLGRVPRIGDVAPRDPDGRLQLGSGRRVLVVFLRCKTFLALRTLANRHASLITCVAVSHASPAATTKWLDLLGGAWNVRVVIDEDRALYAAWGLGVAGLWHVLHPAAQAQAWREKGWLGDRVAEAIQRRGGVQSATAPARAGVDASGRGSTRRSPARGGAVEQGDDEEGEDGPLTVMGNKWQESGAFAVDGRGIVIWGGKALRADDLMNLDEGARLLVM